jgi:SAM-dependent methyltransferase
LQLSKYRSPKYSSGESWKIAVETAASSIASAITDRSSEFAFSNYKKLVLEYSSGKTVMEVGAGRQPVFTPEELQVHQIDYVANDISSVELDAMPIPVPKFAFDVSKSVPTDCIDRFDFIFSKMVQEHIDGTPRYYRNLSQMLKPGGMALNFHPVLYALPFIINRLLPESLSDPLLYLTRKDRTRTKNPKFPALYDHCVVSQKVRSSLMAQGFSDVIQVPFFGHGYYRVFPGLRQVHRRLSRSLQAMNANKLATFCYTIAIK